MPSLLKEIGLKHYIVAIIIVFGLLFFLSTLLSTDSNAYIFTSDGNTVYEDTPLYYISATPATIYGGTWVYSTFISKSWSGDIDIAYGFNTSSSYPVAAQLFAPHKVYYNTSHRIWFYNVSSIVNTPDATPIDYGNSYNTHRYTITYQRCAQLNNTTLDCDEWTEATAVIAFDSYETDGMNYTAYWHTRRNKTVYYYDISGKFQKVNYNYDDKDTWYYILGAHVNAGQMYTIRTRIRTNGGNGKYDIAIKPHSETIPQAIANGHFFILDPWVYVSELNFTSPTPGNATTIYTNHTTINVSISTSELSYFTFNWNGVNKTYTTCGAQWNESTNSYTTTTTVGRYADIDFNNTFPWSEMRRCTLWDNGTVHYYLNATNSSLKADGTLADLSGADGQVMVEIPKFYYSYSFTGSTHHYNISRFNLTGLKVHNAFIKDGVEVDHRYIGAYEGSMWDASTGAMVPSTNITDDMYTSGDKLCSISGEYPKTNERRSEFRAMAFERGAGWRQLDFDLNSAVQLLYLIEYADFNSQNTIGYGRTQLSGGTWTADSYIGQCGKSNSDGDGTNSVGGNTNDAYMTYRGIENWYGHIWKWCDGINIYDHTPYVTNNASNWADDTSVGYIDIGVTLPSANNWQITLCDTDRGFLPASVGVDSSYICDYYWQNTGWRVVGLGGPAHDGARAGAFYVFASAAASYNTVSVGGRLAY